MTGRLHRIEEDLAFMGGESFPLEAILGCEYLLDVHYRFEQFLIENGYVSEEEDTVQA